MEHTRLALNETLKALREGRLDPGRATAADAPDQSEKGVGSHCRDHNARGCVAAVLEVVALGIAPHRHTGLGSASAPLPRPNRRFPVPAVSLEADARAVRGNSAHR